MFDLDQTLRDIACDNKNFDTRAEIFRALELLHPWGYFEIRCLGGGRVWSGYFRDKEKATRAVLALLAEHRVSGVYVTLNVCHDHLFTEGCDDLKPAGRGAASRDSDIAWVTNLLIDFDYERPSGTNATDAEVRASFNKLFAVTDYLASHGFPPPLVAASGNGAHAIYQVSLDPSEGLPARFLKVLSQKFPPTGGVKIDTTVGNPARITKLYGTPTRKGEHTSERPHRYSRIVDAPPREQVPGEALLTLTERLEREFAPPPPLVPSRPSAPYTGAPFDLETWISTHMTGERMRPTGEWAHGPWGYEFPCPWEPEHRDGSLKAFVGLTHDGRAAAMCHGERCSSKHWRDLRPIYEPGCYDRGVIVPEPRWVTRGEVPMKPAPAEEPPHEHKKILGITDFIGDLEEHYNPEDQFHLIGLIPRGAPALFFGPPKSGKSWLMLDSAISLALGEDFLRFRCRDGRKRVLLVEQEDPRDYLRWRIWKLCHGRGRHPHELDGWLYSQIQTPLNFDQQEHVSELAESIERLKIDVIFVDTLRHSYTGDENDSRAAAALCSTWTQLCSRYGVSVCFVHHSRKAKDDSDQLAYLARGSGAIAASARHLVYVEKREGAAPHHFIRTDGNFLPAQEPFAFTIDSESSHDGATHALSLVEHHADEALWARIDALAAESLGGVLTATDIAMALEMHESKALGALRGHPHAIREGRGTFRVLPLSER